MVKLLRYIFGWVDRNLGSNYRKKDGQRLTAYEYKKRRKREIRLHLALLVIVFLVLVTTSVFIVFKVTHKSKDKDNEQVEVEDNTTQEVSIVEAEVDEAKEEESVYLQKSEESANFFEGYSIEVNSDTPYISSEGVYSTYGLLINLDTGNVVASKDGNVRINPASMTKILTLLVAVEHLDDIDNS